jgi:CRISPR/Cas system-associated exonuclease Cas4 (RecB family)
MAIEHISRKIKAGKSYDEIQLKKILEEAKSAHRIKKTDAGDIGTLVHQAIEAYIKTGKEVPPIHEKAKACFENFVKWVKDEKVIFTESERKIYSQKLGYAGTMDFACIIGGMTYIGDTKTASAIYEEMWFQTSAYQQAYEEETGTKADGQVIVRVGKTGDFEIQKNYDYEENVEAFNGALKLYRRIQKLKDAKEVKK